jgi:hypothetical protein
MWSGDSVLSKETLDKGWGEGKTLFAISEEFYKIHRRHLLTNIGDVDPVILIDNCLFDGWGRCSLAHALGQETVMAAFFTTKAERLESIYLTDPRNFMVVKETLQGSSFEVEYEDFNQGLLVFFKSKEDKEKAVSILSPLIDPSLEGNWSY